MITLRPANRDDETTIREIIQTSFLDSYARFLPKEFIQKSLKNNRCAEIAREDGPRFTIAEVNGAPAGVMLAKGDHVEQLWIRPESMGKGIGSALLQAAEAQARKTGHARLTLDCFEKNENALGFYAARGFTVEKTYENKDSMPGIYNCFLTKPL